MRVPVEPYGPLTEVGSGREAWMVPGATVRSVDPQNALRREAEPGAAADPRFTVIGATVAPQDGPPRTGETGPDGKASPRSLTSVMADLGDQQVQLLKLNVGGDEYGLLEALDLRALAVRVLLVELHATRRCR
jgi:hypothetical protein